ncbi:TPA: hypothetical protein N0F65_012790 [Lagenidium giganteum]|uniref:Uncharacterized protein n=1 Tax=Lagenidium giganteum TaxID=4803 RepID=A0AAV2YEF2_9STRA|nr:TPA: hypothetical protein N0F65_012790 [Lagenidium giganteum]
MVASTAVVASGNAICMSVKSCMANGRTECDRSKKACPPCLYSLDDRFSCWDKGNLTNTCPFTGVNSTSQLSNGAGSSSSGGNTSAKAPASSSGTSTTASPDHGSGFGSTAVMIAAGVLALVIVVVIIVAVMRRNKNMRQEQHMAMPEQRRNNKKGGNGGGGDDPYGKPSYNYQRKISEPAMLESGRPSDAGVYSMMPDQKISVDGMLGERAEPLPVMVGSMHRPVALAPAHGGNRGHGAPGFQAPMMIHKDISARVTSGANVFDEYMKMKHEMNYDVDALSDLDSELYSDTMSERKLSIGSSIMDGSLMGSHHQNSRTLSITDSEFAEEYLRRSRGESDAYSEMSYNDEKYSFSEDDRDRDSAARGLDREVEI